MKAWHFIKSDRKLGYGDNRVVVDGETIHHLGDRPINLCESGLHFSIRALDALRYAPGLTACYVDVPDDSIFGDDKGVAFSRTVIKSIDATDIVVRFAILQAMSVYKNIGWVKWANDWLSGINRTGGAAANAVHAVAKAAAKAAYAANTCAVHADDTTANAAAAAALAAKAAANANAANAANAAAAANCASVHAAVYAADAAVYAADAAVYAAKAAAAHAAKAAAAHAAKAAAAHAAHAANAADDQTKIAQNNHLEAMLFESMGIRQ